MLQVFIGYDPHETVAFHVLAHSIMRRASVPVSITPLVRRTLGMYQRERGPTESTEFSLTRFLVPSLMGYRGRAIFMDCDMLVRADIGELYELAPDDGKAVHVVKHEYVPKSVKKFLGQQQTVYPRKNWSSVMLFDCEACRHLTPGYVNSATGLELHRFAWLDENEIGALPLEWNWLVGEYEPNPQAKLLHYTLGGPWFSASRDCDQAADWLDEYQHMQEPLGE